MNKRQDLPERRGEPRIDGEDIHQAALLIDFDNVTMGIRSNLGQELRNLLNSDVIRGKVAVQRAYADWRRYPQYIVPLSEASIDLIFAPAYGSSKKNATDIRLAIDALELVFVRPEIRTFILMSGDSDFSSLVLKLKEYGKYVIGVGIQESSSDLLVQNCDEYYSYSALSGLTREGDQPTERHDPWVLVEKAIDKMVQRSDTMRSDRLKQVMLEIDPSFNEKEQGFSKFNRFVVEAASRGLLSIQKMENGQYGVAPPEKSARVARGERGGGVERGKEERRPQGRRESGRRGRERPVKEHTAKQPAEPPEPEPEQTGRARRKLTMDSALKLLNQVLDQLLENEDAEVRDSDVKRRLLELHPHFDEGELGFNKFSKFLQAAEERNAVRLTRGPNGNYHVGWPGKQKARTEEGSRKQKEEPAPEREPLPRDTTVRRLARFLFGHKEEGEAAAEKPSPQEAPPQPESKAPPRSDRRRPGEKAERTSRARRNEPRGRRPEPADSQAATGSRGGQRRERRKRGGGGEKRPSEREAGRRRSAEGADRERRRREERSDRGASGALAPEAEKGMTASGARAPEAEKEMTASERGSGPAAPSESKPDRDQRTSTAERDAVREAVASARESAAKRSTSEEKRPAATASAATRPAGPPAEDREPAVVPAPMPGAPRGTIRGRWGSRGRYRPAETPPPIFEGQRSPKSDATPEAGPAAGAEERPEVAHAHIIEHLKAHYAGVGEKTAETLVETFGAGLFKVMDEQPERIRAVLPDHRADRVLEARRRERDAQEA